MTCFQLDVPPKDRESGRFLAQVHAQLASAAYEAKKKRGLTQAAVAEQIGCDRGSLSRLLSGGGNPTVRTIGELAWALGYKPELVLRPIEEAQNEWWLSDSLLAERRTSASAVSPGSGYASAKICI